MNVVDSSGWLEYFADGPNASFFADAIETVDALVVPAISIYEMFKRLLQQRSENEALQAVASMQQGRIVALDASLAIHSAKLSSDLKLPMADSIILATAQAHNAVIWTQDADFNDIKGVRFIAKATDVR